MELDDVWQFKDLRDIAMSLDLRECIDYIKRDFGYHTHLHVHHHHRCHRHRHRHRHRGVLCLRRQYTATMPA